MFAYGLLSVVLVLYLVEVGLRGWEVGLLLTLTLAGDTAISLWLTTTADRLGRRRTLMVDALLMALARSGAEMTFVATFHKRLWDSALQRSRFKSIEPAVPSTRQRSPPGSPWRCVDSGPPMGRGL